jgi:streptomycin 6-kinase
MTRIDLGGRGAVELSPYLLGNLRAVHGEIVDSWLASLPETLHAVLTQLDARVVPGDPPLSYHLVFFARQADGTAIAVKCTVPNPEQPPEVAAVQALSDAHIGPRLVWADLDLGVLVMERALPGEMLPRQMPSLDEDAATTRQLARLALRMATEVSIDAWRDRLVPVRHYTRALDEVGAASPLWHHHHADILRARELRDAMLEDPDQPHVFLHGDLQHHNVLTDTRAGVRVIDPKGLVGPAGYEFGTLTWNPPYIQRHPDLAGIERQRVDIWSAETGVPWETVRRWGFVVGTLSACWAERGGAVPWADAMTIATTLRDLEEVG